jgi:hypothetical protein
VEFTVHVPIAYDYRFESPRRDEIMDLLKRLCIIVNGKNVPVFTVATKDLKDFTTTESDMKKQKSRFPPSEYRNKGEDLLSSGL